MDFESSFAGIRKTVDGSEAELAAISEGMRELATTIPVNVNELNRIGEAAGQLGVSKENILGFTDTVAKLGVTTNLAGDQAATTLARLANITQMPEENFDRLGATIVALGNAGASTEAEIAEFGLRLAGAGQIAGLTEANILAIGNALSSVGVEAEAGGTAVQKVLLSITESVTTGDAKLADFARTAGMSAEQFAAAWEADPGEAFVDFVEGIGRAGKGGIQILKQLGLTDQRLIRSFLSLGSAGGELRNSIELGNTAWAENNALNAEAAKRFDTTASKLALANNQINDFKITAGEGILPVLGDIAEYYSESWKYSDRFNESIQSSVPLMDAWARKVQDGSLSLEEFIRLSTNLVESEGLPTAGPVDQLAPRIRELEQYRRDLTVALSKPIPSRAMGLAGSLTDAAGSVIEFGRASGDAKGKVDGLTGSIDAQADALTRLKGASGFLGIEGAAIAAQEASQGLVEAQAKVNSLLRNGKRGTKEYKDALLDLRQAELRAVEARLTLADTVQSYIEKVESGEVSQKDAIALVREYGKMAGLTKEQLEPLIDRIKDAKGAYDTLPGSKKTSVSAPGLDATHRNLIVFARTLAGIPRSVEVAIHVRRLNEPTYPSNVKHAGGPAGSGAKRYGPGLASDEYSTILQRGELVLSRAQRQAVGAGPARSGDVVLKGKMQITNWRTGEAYFEARAGAAVERVLEHEDDFTRDRQPAN